MIAAREESEEPENMIAAREEDEVPRDLIIARKEGEEPDNTVTAREGDGKSDNMTSDLNEEGGGHLKATVKAALDVNGMQQVIAVLLENLSCGRA